MACERGLWEDNLEGDAALLQEALVLANLKR